MFAEIDGGRIILEGADLRGATFPGANISSADMTNADLTGADLNDATFSYDAFERILSIEFAAISTISLGDSYTLIVSSLRDRYGNLALALQATGIVTED